MTLGSPCMVHSGFLRPNRPETVFRTFLSQFKAKSNLCPRKAVGTEESNGFRDFQEAARANSWTGSSGTSWLCGQPEQHALAHGPRASSMIALMVRAQRPHSALQPRHP